MRKLLSAVAICCLASACTATPAAVDFEDPLTGPVSPAWDIPFQKYRLTPEGILRTHSASGSEDGTDRPVIKTVSGAYLTRDFVFEVDVTIPNDHGDIVFVGLGRGLNNPSYYNEPADAVLFRIHSLPSFPHFGIEAVVADRQIATSITDPHFRHQQRIADYTPGQTLRVRIAHQQGSVTLSIPAIPNASVTFPREQFGDLFDGRTGYLFLTNTSSGTTFRNATVRTP